MSINLPVPYKSQHDSDASRSKNDCGPASIAMILGYYGENVTTDQVHEKTGAGGGLIGINQMVKAIESFGYKTTRFTQATAALLKSWLDQGIPVIALVKYGSLGSTVQDKTFTGGHFFTVVGYREDGYFVNDPNFWGDYRAHGDHHFYPKADFEKAWADTAKDNNQPNSFQVIHPKNQIPNPPSGNDCLVPNTENNRKTQDKLVHNSGLADEVVKYLGLADKADNVDFSTIKNSLEARDGKLTTCKNELSTRESDLAKAQQEVSNREEQVSRLKDELLEHKNLHKAELEALKSAQKEPEKLIEQYQSTIEQLRSDLKKEAKAKGQALNDLAEVKTQLENAQKGQFGDLTLNAWVQLFWTIKW